MVIPPPTATSLICLVTTPVTLAKVEILYSAASTDLAAFNKQFSLLTSDPCHHHEAMRDMDSERWHLGKHNKCTYLKHKYNIFHPVNCSKVPPDTKILGACFIY